MYRFCVFDASSSAVLSVFIAGKLLTVHAPGVDKARAVVATSRWDYHMSKWLDNKPLITIREIHQSTV